MHSVFHADRVDLDGRWRFQLLPAPDAEPAAGWGEIDVPGCWTMQGWGDLPHYTNVVMPFPGLPPAIPPANPTGLYEREVEVPAGWAGRRIVLHVGAAESVLVARVNGREVGISKDSHLAAEFDVTDVVAVGRNAISLTVVKWSDASYVEDQDQWWHGGITRSVFLYATERIHLADVRVIPTLAEDLASGSIEVRAEVAFSRRPARAGLDGGGAPRRSHRAPWRPPCPTPAASRARAPAATGAQLADRAIAGMPLTRRGAHRPLAAPVCRPRPGERWRGHPAGRRGRRAALVLGAAGPLPAHGHPALARRCRGRGDGGARRLPPGGDRRAGPADQPAARPHPRRESPRLRPAHRAGDRARGHAGRPRPDEALRVQRRADLALPERPGVPGPLRRARAVRHRRGRHRVARVHRQRLRRPALPGRVGRPRGADGPPRQEPRRR